MPRKFLKTRKQFLSEVRRPDSDVFVEESTYSQRLIKKRVLDQQLIEYKCAICNIGPLWNNLPMPLILDHINGVHNDHRISNLRFVCSNCDTQLPTYKSKNKMCGRLYDREYYNRKVARDGA